MNRYKDDRIPLVKNATPRKKKGNRRLIMILAIFFVLVLSIVFFRSPYSKVTDIQVYGNILYTKEQIIQASTLTNGMQFLNVWDSDVEAGISTLKGIKDISISRDFPGVIRLNIQEYRRTALYVNGQKQPGYLLEDGTILTPPTQTLMMDRPIIQSWSSKDPKMLKQLAEALISLQGGVLHQISDLSLIPTKYDSQQVVLNMRDGNEIRSTLSQLKKKLPWYPSIVQEIPKGQKGIVNLLDVAWFEEYSHHVTNQQQLQQLTNPDGSLINESGTDTSANGDTQNRTQDQSSQTTDNNDPNNRNQQNGQNTNNRQNDIQNNGNGNQNEGSSNNSGLNNQGTGNSQNENQNQNQNPNPNQNQNNSQSTNAANRNQNTDSTEQPTTSFE
ncbi:FtsQ-type POTRA domain-containing protein [Brevibacillus halotolerans]|uniref:cell division protein FtsQ/DivIB n=1 Tax=Brevibacillus TaxID=55080 RepID=UPI00215C9E18|nr:MULTISPECIES: FtsQ-type POTRA domain-containing protein [Brevibacillus]MCR8962242.1 FtsQ-type POTRA domain-containing protein [Brevibacillus laterosporus]MCZ0834397.1 FtsQ-type POTRA domain-containing protein [Brevibacillus halotolerans]